MDRRSPWSQPDTVAGFVRSPPNQTLISFAGAEHESGRARVVVDIGCGAGRNAIPLARAGSRVIGLDSSAPMLAAARARLAAEPVEGLHFVEAAMEALPIADASADLVVAHGIWNLARSGEQFRRAVAEGARIARPDAALFVFTFSRHTLASGVTPIDGETFVYTEFSGEPQCFLTREQLMAELSGAGFTLDDRVVALREHNRPASGALRTAGGPVIYEAVFRRVTR